MNKRTLVEFVVRFTAEAAGNLDKLVVNGFPSPAPGDIAQVTNDCLALLRLASQHQRMCERACSDPRWDSEDGSPDEKAKDRIEQKAAKLLKPYGIGLNVSGDPRGATFKLKLPSGYSDSWGGDGFCVPADGYTAEQMKRMGW